MTFEEKTEKWIAEKFADFPYQQTALHSIEWARQETLREVIPVLEKAVQHWGDYAPQRTNARQTLDEAKDLLKKLEAEREG